MSDLVFARILRRRSRDNKFSPFAVSGILIIGVVHHPDERDLDILAS
jgi:hypothetical protein